MTELVLIAAVARNGVIGDGERMPWHLPEDLAFFREATRDRPVIMGRRTWQSLPERFRPLPARRNLVVSRDAAFQAPGAEVVDSLDAALEQVRDDGGRVFVIGGEQLFALALPRAQVLVLTEIDRDFDGRTRFPDWPRADFIEAWRTRHDSGLGFGYERAEYRRRA
ncbi:MAG TPA: dihydrofolate reductase [Rubrivivax sp.]|nr:dihydrofolate reductase [Rubrivivax sp.]HRY86285.1 dihydrofolate reductase [Rubrivivax sp.]HRZ60100.1 dihydrofolate reductase [Rubrivivax sp.]